MARFVGWIASSDPIVWESVGRTGYDLVVLDLQHGGLGFTAAIRAIQLLDSLGVETMARISSTQIQEAPRYMDFGLKGIVVATVDDAEAAARAVSFTRYQPSGIRSYGGARMGLGHEPDDVGEVLPKVWPMIETADGAKNSDAIAAVPGVTGLLVGPADLSRAYGLPPSHRSKDSRWNDALARVVEVCGSRGIASGMNANDGEDAAHWAAQGFDYVVIASDIAHLRAALARQLAIARRGPEDASRLDLYGSARRAE
jgi:4-hydroxy-2-oxoheptanedioate aldolase